jgi:hypothetical protein
MIQYHVGDCLTPMEEDGDRLILHVCNNKGAWGAGFVMAVSARWPKPEKLYRASFQNGSTLFLGDIQIVQVEPDVYVVNMVAQDGFPPQGGISYTSLLWCMEELGFRLASYDNPSLHLPRIGCGIGGGMWPPIENILKDIQKEADIPIHVYDLHSKRIGVDTGSASGFDLVVATSMSEVPTGERYVVVPGFDKMTRARQDCVVNTILGDWSMNEYVGV